MTDPLRRFRDANARRAAAGVDRTLRPRAAGGDGLVDLAGNDYLGLTRDPRVVDAAGAAARTWGAGSTGSRLVTGTTALHAELEAELADFAGARAALVFSSGYLANLGAITVLGGKDILLVSDAVNHASIVDACRLSASRVVIVPHRDVAAVERALTGRAEPGAVVVTDALFSVDGDLAPLAALYEVTHRHGALLMIDEAHTIGVVGEGGRGGGFAAGLAGLPDVVQTVTLSKSLGAQGGAVLAAPEIVQSLIETGRPFIFDTGLAPAAAGAALAALRILAAAPELAIAVRTRARQLARAAQDAGLPTTEPDGAVLAVRIGDPHQAVRMQALCAERGLRVGCFRPPSVPAGQSCLRLTARADLTDDDVTRFAAAMAAVAKELA